MTDPVANEWIVFLPDMPHLTKNIVTSLKLSPSKTSKRNLMMGKVPINMQMMHKIWFKCNGACGQLQSTKLTSRHFDKNAFSRMNVKLVTQLLSQSTVKMVRYAISDESVVLSLRNKEMHNHVADLWEHWNYVVDICNGRDGPHSSDNAAVRQSHLFDTLVWFFKWKELRDERVRKKLATEFIFSLMRLGSASSRCCWLTSR
jgi:hypothetical protein